MQEYMGDFCEICHCLKFVCFIKWMAERRLPTPRSWGRFSHQADAVGQAAQGISQAH